jgi:hypothetical protein
MMLAHHRREAPLELAEEIAEARVAVAVGINLPVLLETMLKGGNSVSWAKEQSANAVLLPNPVFAPSGR